MLSSICGTPNYMAPELVRGKIDDNSSYSFSIDWWSLGVTTFEMVLGFFPFDSKMPGHDHIYHNILHKKLKFPNRQKYKLEVSDDCEDFIRKCLEKDVSKRFQNVDEVLAHPWFSDLDAKKM